jgi:hypothetical protein
MGPPTFDAVKLAVPAAGPAPAAPLQWIRAAQGQETRLIAIDEVIYFQSNDKYTSVFVADGEHLIRTPLRQLREQLDPQQFWQIHRGAIVAARHVAGTRTESAAGCWSGSKAATGNSSSAATTPTCSARCSHGCNAPRVNSALRKGLPRSASPLRKGRA